MINNEIKIIIISKFTIMTMINNNNNQRDHTFKYYYKDYLNLKY